MGTHQAGNAWWDGTNWQRFDTTQASCAWIANGGGIVYYTTASGTGAISWVQRLAIDPTGAIGIHTAPLAGYSMRMAGLGETSATFGFQHVNSQVSRNIFYTRDDGYVYMAGPVQIDGSATLGGQFNGQYIVCEGIDIGAGPLYFAHNGGVRFYWDGTYMHSSQSMVIDGTSLILANNGSIAWTWDGYMHTAQAIRAGGSIMSDASTFYLGTSGSYYINLSSNVCQMANMNLLSWGWVGFSANGGINWSWNGGQLQSTHNIVNTGGTYYFVNTTVSLGWNGGGLQCSHYLMSGGPIYLSGNGGVNFTWDGTYIRPSVSLAFNTVGNQIVWPNGSFISGNSGYVQGSSRALKLAVQAESDSAMLDLVTDTRMPVSTYLWEGEPRRTLGFIADDVASVLPDYVLRDDEGEPAGYSPQELTAILWGAVRHLETRVRERDDRIAALEARLAA